ncbi:uncharacterized protein LOC143274584 [Babylonia areolata]|uniref:uncharacterized protein LOC143274584 n=1 Tax=Babylonia areolata TaxID=304850 RepID=UPI003FD18644
MMSTVGDENSVPGMSLKGAASAEGGPSTALKQSNKANIMSPPLSPRKKLDRGDGLASTDGTLIKENLDQTLAVDSSAIDDDDIISFKPPQTMKADNELEADPFKPETQLANSPVFNSRQTVTEPMPSASSTLESGVCLNVQDSHVKDSGPSCSDSYKGETLNNVNESGICALDPLAASNPLQPQSQMINSPVKTSEGITISHGKGDISKNVDDLTKPSEDKGESVLSNDKLDSNFQETKTCGNTHVESDSNPLKASSQLPKSPTKESVDVDPFRPRQELVSSPTADTLDPFKSGKQLPNSPGYYKMAAEPSLHPQPPTSCIQQGEADHLVAESKESSTGETSIQASTQQSAGLTDKTTEVLDLLKPQQQLDNSHKKPFSETDIDLDPFKPKTQLTNSPAGAGSKEDVDPFCPKIQLPNSPSRAVSSDPQNSSSVQSASVVPISQPGGDPVHLEPNASEQIGSSEENQDASEGKQSLSEKKEDITSGMDAFKPRIQLVNSPSKTEEIGEETDPFKPKAQLADFAKTEEIDPFKPKAQLANSPAKTEDVGGEIDPFKSKAQLANSSAKSKEMDPFKPKAQLVNSPTKTEETDPFKPKAQLVNSPAKTEETDPFKPKAQLANSPGKTEEVGGETDPFKPKAQLANSPTKTEEIGRKIDPFKPKAQLANSPGKTEEIGGEIDPFKPKAQLANSPAKSGETVGETDPFKPKAQLANSPAKNETIETKTDSFVHNAKSVNSETGDTNTDADPIKPQTQGIHVEMDPLKSKSQPEKSVPCVDEGDDPFKPTVQLVDSPAKKENVCTDADPFRPKTQLANSPTKADDIFAEVNPFQPKAQLANSPMKMDESELDPFKPKTYLANSPAKPEGIEAEMDPFKPKTQLGNSPAKDVCVEADPFKPKTQLANSPEKLHNTAEPDPFKAKTQLANSPDKKIAEKEKTGTLQDSSQSGEKVKSSAVVLDGLDALESMMPGAVASNPVLLASGQDLGFDENMFISGTQAFSDPAALDLLEQFGGTGETKETDLRKCSLYVKFDPLVKPTLPKTPEKMPAPMHAAPRRAGARQHDLLNFSQLNTSQVNTSVGEESICLLGTPPKINRRRSVLSQRRMNTSSVSQTITEEESAKPVDLLFSLDGDTSEDRFLNDPSKKSETTSSALVEVEEGARYTESQWQELQQQLAMQYEGQMLARERKLTAQLDKQQQQLDTVTAEKLKLSEKIGAMASCVEEYEKTLNMLIMTKEKSSVESKSQVEELKKERDQALEDVQALENSFSEFHRRYEKLKQTLDGFRKNETTLKETVKMWQEKVKASEENMAKVKAKAEEKIKEMLSAKEKKEADMARVEAELKRTKLQVQSLESTLEQKRQENKDLTELCDTLIAQVGGSGK